MAMQMVEETSNLGVALIGCDYLSALALGHILHRSSSLYIVGEFPRVRDISSMLEVGSIDLILMDAGLGDIELTRACEELSTVDFPPTMVVLGDVHPDLAEHLIVAGVTAIIRRGGIAEDLATVLRVIHQGETLILSARDRHFLKPRARHSAKLGKDSYGLLSPQERSVADGVAEGLSNATIARKLHVSEATVKLLVAKIMTKFGVSNRVQIAVMVTQAQHH